MIEIFIMSTNLTFLGLLKIKEFRNQGNDAINNVHDITNKILYTRLKLYCRYGHVTKVW